MSIFTALFYRYAYRFLLLLLFLRGSALAQRTYAPHSVLAAGNWYKLAVAAPGMYKIDVGFLGTLGVPTGTLASSAIRIFGNGGQLPGEACSAAYTDDLRENALLVVDGGDGLFNNNDYLLFYAPGPDGWEKDSLGAAFKHTRNIYTGKSYYYLTIGGNGLRIPQALPPASPNVTITNYDARFFHELDTVNFLKSGKEWYGEEFAVAPGKTNTRDFTALLPGYVPGGAVQLRSSVVSRSNGAFSRFDIRVNGVQVLQQPVAFTGTGSTDPFAVADLTQAGFVSAQPVLSINYTYTPGSVNAQGWLNHFTVQARSALNMAGSNLFFFRDWLSVGAGNTGNFILQNVSADTRVWDITDFTRPVQRSVSISGSTLQFAAPCAALREYLAFSGNAFPAPQALGSVSNQDLHNSAVADFLIITHPLFLAQAQRIAIYHTQRENLRCVVATTDQVYAEFGSGAAQPVAIRDYVKMYFDKAAGDPAKQPRYLLLFGAASFDYKDRINPNTNFVPAYESVYALESLATYTSDDFFGYLEDADDINDPARLNLLDIGIGRLPVRTLQEATQVVDKLVTYHDPVAFGAWRNEITLVADDEDNNLHLLAAEQLHTTLATAAPVLHSAKIYLDAYRQQSGAGGSRYPDANALINNRATGGNLVWNYSGHGSSRRLAEEVALDEENAATWKNEHKLPLLVTATCDFVPYDDPLTVSLGSQLLLRARTGAMGLVTTTRLVFASSNQLMNNNFLKALVTRQADGTWPALGTVLRQAKNQTYQTSPDIGNNRKFTLLGDPALTLALPAVKAVATHINNQPVGAAPDTLKALGTYTIRGQMTDAAGNLLANANGTVYTTIYDKPQLVNTLGNDPGSNFAGFTVQDNALYRGKVRLTNGRFACTFIVPRDIAPQYGNGRAVFYAGAADRDGHGLWDNLIVGGQQAGVTDDKTGPVLRAFLNDEKFVNGGLCNESPVLIVRLKDSSGINASGLGIGHDITAVLDNDNRQLFELNDFYEADLDSYRSGVVRFQLPLLEAGRHTLTIRAWDVFNNPGTYVLEFTVAKQEELTLDHVLNYPNPFTTRTAFWFEHNRPGEDMQLMIRIMSVSGKLVKTISSAINTPGNRSCETEWDGRDDFGQPIGRGVYWYTLTIQSRGQRAVKRGKLLIL